MDKIERLIKENMTDGKDFSRCYKKGCFIDDVELRKYNNQYCLSYNSCYSIINIYIDDDFNFLYLDKNKQIVDIDTLKVTDIEYFNEIIKPFKSMLLKQNLENELHKKESKVNRLKI